MHRNLNNIHVRIDGQRELRQARREHYAKMAAAGKRPTRAGFIKTVLSRLQRR